MAEADTRISGKDLLFLVPIFGSALAVFYEVGFFYAFDISYLTLFTISEHILFALSSLPVFLSIILTIPFSILMYKLGEQSALKALPTIPKEPVTPEQLSSISTAIQTYWAKTLSRQFTMALIMIPIVVFLFVQGAFRDAAVGATFVVLALCNWAFPKIFSGVRPLLIGYAFGAGLICVAAGFEDGRAFAKPAKPITLITLGERDIPVGALRSGDRGILTFDTVAKQIALFRWDDIKKIALISAFVPSAPQPLTPPAAPTPPNGPAT